MFGVRVIRQSILIPSFIIFAGACLYGQEVSKPNILFVIIDALRPDHLGCYGYERQTSPTIDSIASQGTRFETVISTSSWTTPSVMSAFTSMLPRSHTVIDVNHRLPDQITTLAAELKAAGYTTIGVSVNPCAAATIGFDRGFDIFDDFTILLEVELNAFDPVGMGKRTGITSTTTSRKISNLALQYLRQVPADKPWFLFLFYFDPHADYVPPRRYIEEFDSDYDGPVKGEVIMKGLAGYTHRFEDNRDLKHTIARYDGEIRYTDDEFGRFLAIAGEEELLGNSLLTIITSDHGEEFNEHGGLQHGRTLYEEVIRIPLIIRWPEHIPAGAAIYDPVQIVDIKPTLLSLLDLEVPQQAAGSDLSKVIKTGLKAPARRMALHVRSIGEAAALRCSRYKAILDMRTGEAQVFDLAEDPAETTPLSKQEVEANQEATSLLKQLMEWNKSTENALRRTIEFTGGQKSTLTEQQTEALRSLGYIQ